jgi:hypothetical protein
VFEINNTTGKTNLKMSFLLQSSDYKTAPRTTTWAVDYGKGDSPATFTTVTATGTLTTGNNVFSSTTVNVDFGSALDNTTGKIYIRITAPAAASGSGNRASTAIDDVKFTWN